MSDTDVIHQTTILTIFMCFVLDIDYRALELCNHGMTLPKIKHFTYIIKKYVVFTALEFGDILSFWLKNNSSLNLYYEQHM